MALAVVGGSNSIARERKAFRVWLKRQVALFYESTVGAFLLLSPPFEEAELRLPVIIIVETNTDLAAKVKSHLNWARAEGYAAFWAKTGDEAVRIAQGLGY